ncbi:NmrA-like family protein [Penicillium lividum]|nr:NmrA-like family protein [Penicillium lividum]
MSKIGVFPASGGLGGSVVQHLQTLVPASELILIARNPSRLSDAKKAGATIRQADYDDPSSLENAFDGIHSLMLISYASFEIEHRVKVHRHAIDMAIKSGVKHIFYSSLAFAGISDKSVAHVMGAHLATEEYLSKSTEITYTIIREGIYSESFPIYTSWFDLQNPVDEITIPHDGTGAGVAWVKRDELGEATAKIITSYSRDSSFKYMNKMVLLSGQRVISLAETVETLGRAVGKDVRLREIGIEEYVALPHAGRHTYHGVDLSREWASAWEAIKAGETAIVSSDIVDILGREPERYEDTIRNLAA